MSGQEVKIPFYITKGDGILLLGNEVCHKSYLLGPENVLLLPPGVQNISQHQLAFETYSEATTSNVSNSVRTYLFVVPSKVSSFTTFFAAQKSYSATDGGEAGPSPKYGCGKVARRFARKLHGYTHMTLDDMVTLCQRGKVLTNVLRQALKSAADKCTSCKSTGRPLQSRKVSFSKIIATFKEHVQIDFFFIQEFGKDPIFHCVDTKSAFSAVSIQDSRLMDSVGKIFEQIWVNTHGSPQIVSGDIEFFNAKFVEAIRYFGIKFQPRPARQHNKIGLVERKHSVVRTLAQRLLKDAEYFSESRGTTVDKAEILSRATFFSNVLYGSKKLSSFEMVRGYTPSLVGLPQRKVSTQLMDAHEEQVARRALSRLEKSRSPHCIKPDELSRDDRVYFFKRGPKFGKWELAFVRGTDERFAVLSSKPDHRGRPIRAGYEDVRLVPKSSLLQDLDEMEFLFPRSYSVVDEDYDEIHRVNSLEPIFPELPLDQIASTADEPPDGATLLPDEPPPSRVKSDETNLGDMELANTNDIEKMFEEEQSLWASHPSTVSLFCNTKAIRSQEPLQDISPSIVSRMSSMAGSQQPQGRRRAMPNLNQSHEPAQPEKDIGEVPVCPPPRLPCDLSSSEQKVLHQAKDVVGMKPTTEFKLQFVPRWVLNKSISAEKENYQGAYEEVDIKTLPRNANIISSHHFFQVKHDGSKDKLKLKCRLVPHGNRDKEKDKVRKDSATAQFPVIRLILSIASILSMAIASIDIKGAYLQGGDFPREIYVRAPKGWASSLRKVWKILKPAYGIVESGRLWQLVVEAWMVTQGVLPVPGLPQLFVKRDQQGAPTLLIAKVVDDFLLVGIEKEIRKFHDSISTRFTVGRFLVNCDIIFNGLHISKTSNGSVQLSMVEYMQGIEKIEIPKERLRQREEKCTDKELRRFLSLTGSLNFLGHGILPQASFAASHLQQCVGNLLVSDLVNGNKVLAEIKSLSPSITFPSPESHENPSYLAFSDASQGTHSYGQTGYLSGIFLPAGGRSIYRVIDWLSCKQSRVSFSSIGAEILAAATASDRGALIAESLKVVNASQDPLPFILTVDSNGLYSTVTTLHEGAEYRLRPTVSRMRDSYEVGEISVMQWIPGRDNLADALTKRNVVMYQRLNQVMVDGILGQTIMADTRRTKYGEEKKVQFTA